MESGICKNRKKKETYYKEKFYRQNWDFACICDDFFFHCNQETSKAQLMFGML